MLHLIWPKVHRGHIEQLYLCQIHFFTNPARKFGISDITCEISSCLQYSLIRHLQCPWLKQLFHNQPLCHIKVVGKIILWKTYQYNLEVSNNLCISYLRLYIATVSFQDTYKVSTSSQFYICSHSTVNWEPLLLENLYIKLL